MDWESWPFGPIWLVCYVGGGLLLGGVLTATGDGENYVFGGFLIGVIAFAIHYRAVRQDTPEEQARARVAAAAQAARVAIPPEAHCPTCNSGAELLERISVGSKVAAGAAFGLFAAGRMAKTFRCRYCGYTW